MRAYESEYKMSFLNNAFHFVHNFQRENIVESSTEIIFR